MRQSGIDHARSVPPLRRASDRTPLGQVTGRIEQAWGTGDYDRAVELLDEDFIAAWYGFSPERFVEIIRTLEHAAERKSPLLSFASAALQPGGLAGLGVVDDLPDTEDAGGADFGAVAILLVARMFGLRMEGRAGEAMEASAELDRRFGGIRPIFDSLRGWGLFSSVQHGITAMLAGDFRVAIECFTQARMQPLYPPLAFLTRDACVKAAIIEALYGSPDRARTLLDRAEEVPRTESWAEDVIDAGQAIAASVVRADDPAEALRMLDAVPLRAIGEIWPFYAAALQRACLLGGDLDDARRRLEVIERLPLPRIDGEGYVGSALLLSGAMRSIMYGDLAEARARLERADASLALTRGLFAALELAVGRPREALKRAAGLYEETRDLRVLEMRRLAVIAGSHLALGAPDDCREVLQFALRQTGGVTVEDALYFPPEVRRFAEEIFAEWPHFDADAAAGFDIFQDSNAALTERELEVLGDLASGQSREQIAKARFISLNTLKAHLRSIYRKLGVNSRAAALLEAERRGVL